MPAGGCNYDVTFNQEGFAVNSIPDANSFLGYPTTTQLGRVCVPIVSVFTNGFDNIVASSSSTISSALEQGYLADFITDV